MDPNRTAESADDDPASNSAEEQQRNDLMRQLLQQNQMDQHLRTLQRVPTSDTLPLSRIHGASYPLMATAAPGQSTMTTPVPAPGTVVVNPISGLHLPATASQEGTINPVSSALAQEVQTILGGPEPASAQHHSVPDNSSLLLAQNQFLMLQQFHHLQQQGHQLGVSQSAPGNPAPSVGLHPLINSQLGFGGVQQHDPSHPASLVQQQESLSAGNMLHQSRGPTGLPSAFMVPGQQQHLQQQQQGGWAHLTTNQVGVIPPEAQALFGQQLASRVSSGLGFPGAPSPGSLLIPSTLPNAFMTEEEKKLSAKLVARKGSIEPFPEKLHRLLTEVQELGRSDIISFVDDGSAFEIHKPQVFFQEIVPRYFKHSKLSSFKRQLNLYGFELIATGPHRGGYIHPKFREHAPELCRQIRRRDLKASNRSGVQMPPPSTGNEGATSSAAADASLVPEGAEDDSQPRELSSTLETPHEQAR